MKQLENIFKDAIEDSKDHCVNYTINDGLVWQVQDEILIKSCSNITIELMIRFANWIAENYIPNGRKDVWDSVELNSEFESKYLIDGTKELLEIFLKEKYGE